jgi:aryl-alcohol dehydrogenase-like predicted oxidoreductase
VRYKLLGRSGLRVSELCLGTMTFGEDWGWGASKDESRKIFEAFVEAGGNFIDTANNYTDGTSERYVGDFIASERDRFIVATKYTLSQRMGDPNAGGNHRKSMVRALEDSLKRLNTDYVDLFWLHMWDYTTPVEEILRAFDDLVRAGKALHVGISDTPAWVIAKANAIADLRGWSRFVALQAEYSLLQRTAERELLPMARDSDMAVLAFAVLEGGELTGKYNRATAEPKRSDQASERGMALAETLIGLASEIGRTPAQVAINWVRQQRGAPIIPILGARSAAQLRDNLGCLEFELTAEQIARLADANPLDPGFPHYFLALPHLRKLIYSGMFEQIDNHRNK